MPHSPPDTGRPVECPPVPCPRIHLHQLRDVYDQATDSWGVVTVPCPVCYAGGENLGVTNHRQAAAWLLNNPPEALPENPYNIVIERDSATLDEGYYYPGNKTSVRRG